MTPDSTERRGADQLMMGGVPDRAALGRGPNPSGNFTRHEYHHPAAGWGAAKSVGKVLERAGEPLDGFRAIFVMNQEDGGFDCPGCAWPDDPDGLDSTSARTASSTRRGRWLRAKADRDVLRGPHRPRAGRLERLRTRGGRPARRAAESTTRRVDKYEPISWEDAFDTGRRHAAARWTARTRRRSTPRVGSATRRRSSTSCGCASSARTTCPTARTCATRPAGRALTAALGTGKGTVDLHDWEEADAIWVMGDNAATNAPRMLT